jgi:hypothetical protein
MIGSPKVLRRDFSHLVVRNLRAS